MLDCLLSLPSWRANPFRVQHSEFASNVGVSAFSLGSARYATPARSSRVGEGALAFTNLIASVFCPFAASCKEFTRPGRRGDRGGHSELRLARGERKFAAVLLGGSSSPLLDVTLAAKPHLF